MSSEKLVQNPDSVFSPADLTAADLPSTDDALDTLCSRPAVAPAGPGACPDLPAGTVVSGKYEILEKLGQGGMGTVYKARQEYVDRVVALKILNPNLVGNEEYLHRFKREAFVAGKIAHPSAVTVFDFGVENGLPYLAMQFVEGITLKQLLLTAGALPLERIHSILSQVGGALAQAHSLGIVHRDLKPDNIMLTEEEPGFERAYVLDFGIAKPLSHFGETGETGDVGLTRSGMLMGTPQYMSPEQALDQPCDIRTDIYSLGCILYEMLTGDVPFRSNSPIELLYQQIHKLPQPVRDFTARTDIPAAVCELVMKALEKKPEDRVQTVPELLCGFRDALVEQLDVSPCLPEDETPTVQQSIPQEIFRDVRRGAGINRAAVGAGALVTLLCIGGFYLLGSRSPAGLSSLAYREPRGGLREGVADVSNVAARDEARNVNDTTIPPNGLAETAPGEGGGTKGAEPGEAVLALGPVSAGTDPAGTYQGPSSMPGEAVPGAGPGGVTNVGQVDSMPTSLAAATPAEITDQSHDAIGAESVPLSNNSQAMASATTEPGLVSPGGVAEPSSDFDRFAAAFIAEQSKAAGAGTLDVDAAYKKGKALFDEGRYLAAADLFKEVVSRRPKYLPGRLSLGASLLRLGAPELAAEHFKAAQAQNPDYPPTLYNLAAYYAAIDDGDRSIETLKRAVVLYPKIRGWLATDSDFDKLRSDERFQQIASTR